MHVLLSDTIYVMHVLLSDTPFERSIFKCHIFLPRSKTSSHSRYFHIFIIKIKNTSFLKKIFVIRIKNTSFFLKETYIPLECKYVVST